MQSDAIRASAEDYRTKEEEMRAAMESGELLAVRTDTLLWALHRHGMFSCCESWLGSSLCHEQLSIYVGVGLCTRA